MPDASDLLFLLGLVVIGVATYLTAPAAVAYYLFVIGLLFVVASVKRARSKRVE